MVESCASRQRRPPCKTNKGMSDEAADAAALTYLLPSFRLPVPDPVAMSCFVLLPFRLPVTILSPPCRLHVACMLLPVTSLPLSCLFPVVLLAPPCYYPVTNLSLCLSHPAAFHRCLLCAARI